MEVRGEDYDQNVKIVEMKKEENTGGKKMKKKEKYEKYLLKNVWEKLEKQEEKLNKIIYIKDGYIEIRVYPKMKEKSPIYDIELETCKDFKSILNWVYHLLGKQWINLNVLDKFIILACDYNNLKIQKD